MAKVNFDNLNVPRKSPGQKRSYEDKVHNPGVVVDLYWQAIDPLQEPAIRRRALELNAMYVTGGFTNPKSGERMDEPLAFYVGNEPANIEWEHCYQAATIEALQAPPAGEEKYWAEDLWKMARTMPNAYYAVLADKNRYENGEGWEKKDSGEQTAKQP